MNQANETTALKRELASYKQRVCMSNFVMNVVTIICLFSFVLSGLDVLADKIPVGLIIISLVLLFSAPLYLVVRHSELSAKMVGLTTKNWKHAVIESVLYTLPMLGLVLLIKWIFIHVIPGFDHHPLFEPYIDLTSIMGVTEQDPMIWTLALIVYCFIAVPAQELITRGALQGALQLFLVGKHKTFLAIIVSNLIFAITHVYLSLHMASLLFSVGIFFGWLYSRHKTLAGVYISHLMLGTWALFIVGV